MAGARQDATTLKRPRRNYDFTAFSRSRPNQQPPGDRIDAEFDAHADIINRIIDRLEALSGPLTADRLDPNLTTSLVSAVALGVRNDVEDAGAAAGSARVDALAAVRAAHDAKVAAANAALVAARAESAHADALVDVRALAKELADGQAQALRDLKEPTLPPALLGPNTGGFYAGDAAGANATAADYAQVSIEWAEHMPDTIPPNILAINAITGEHWSSRWWAHRAGEYVNGWLTGYYLGPFPVPPISTATGEPIPVGSIYFNTSNNMTYIWTGSAWVPFNTPQKAATAALFYEAQGGQTDFPLTDPDIFGNLIAGLDPAGDEGIEVCLNGVRLTPSSPTFAGDYDVDVPTSTIVLAQPVGAQSLLCVDVLLANHKLAPAFVLVQKLLPIQPDGVLTTFDLLDPGGNSVQLADSTQLVVVMDGVDQEPGADFTVGAGGTTIVFPTPPAADSKVFIVHYGNSLVGGGGQLIVHHDPTLHGSGTPADPLGVVDATSIQPGAVNVPQGGALLLNGPALTLEVATQPDVDAGLNNTHPVTPATLRVVSDARYVNRSGDTMTGPLTVQALVGDSRLSLEKDTVTGHCSLDFADTGVSIWSLIMRRAGVNPHSLTLQRNSPFGVFLDEPLTIVNPVPSVAGNAQFQFAGQVFLDRAPTQAFHAATKDYVDRQITGAQQVIGSFNAQTGICNYTAASGFPDGPLIPATQAGANHYVIVEIAGLPPPGLGPPETEILVAVGDWWMSDGAQWLHLAVGSPAELAANIATIPPVFNADDVQEALENAEAAVADRLIKAGDVMTGPLTLAADPTLDLHAATKQYVDAVAPAGTYVPTTGGTMTGNLVVSNQNGIGTAKFIFQKFNTAFTEERMLDARTGGALGAFINYDGGVNRSDEGRFSFYTENGGYSTGLNFRTTIASPPGIFVTGDSSATSHTNRSEAFLKQDIRYDADTCARAFDALKPAMFKLKDIVWPPVDGEGRPKKNPYPKPENRDRFGFVVDDMAADPLLSLAVNQDYTTKERGYDIAQVLALAVAKIKQLEAELADLRAQVLP